MNLKITKKPLIIGAALGLIILGFVYFLITPSKNIPPLSPLTEDHPGTPPLTPEKRAILSQIQTHQIFLENGQLSSPQLTVHQYDQVTWENKDEEIYQIKGEGWGGIPIPPQRRFTQAFSQKGAYPYSCPLHPEIRGIIVVE